MSTQNTVDDIVAALTGLIKVAPDVIAIINTIKTEGSISLETLQKLQAERQAAFTEAEAALTSGD